MSEVQLKNQHLWLSASLAGPLFGVVAQVFVAFESPAGPLRVAPMDHPTFSKAHKASLQMLKSRNLAGDKTISLQELLIDQSLDDSDRPLSWEADYEQRILLVSL